MAISNRVDFSHKYSYKEPVKGVFRIILVPEKTTIATGLHYIVLIDNSGSMAGEKLETAKNGAIELLNRIPEGNKVTLITFSTDVKVLAEYEKPKSVIPLIPNITVEGATALYAALNEAIKIAKKRESPGCIVLLTDGQPTDVEDLEAYKNLEMPNGFKVIAFGIGLDYNEELLKVLADKTGGILNHIKDPREVANALPQVAVSQIGARNVEVNVISESKVTLLNYTGLPVKFGAIEGVIRIWGELMIPPNYSGNLINVRVDYEDPVSGKRESQVSAVQVTPAKDTQTFVSGVNKDLMLEYQYYALMKKLEREVSANDLVSATRTLNEMEKISQQTRNIGLIQTTRTLKQSFQGSTVDLKKEIASQVTKKMRS